MYNFIITDNKKKINNYNLAETENLLIGIKRLLPRWLNSLPDIEFIAILRKLFKQNTKKIHIVETGIGSSTLLFLHFAMLKNGKLFSWDINSTKASYINMIASETLCRIHKKPVSSFWNFFNSSSLNKYTGLEILNEAPKKKINVSFHDSEHTWNVISNEINLLNKLYNKDSYIFIDDANQNYIHTYEPIINMIRKKNNLRPIKNLKNNIGESHYDKLKIFFKKNFKTSKFEDSFFKKNIKKDIFYKWYENDRNKMNMLNMEKLKTLNKRFAIVKINFDKKK